MTQEKCPMCQKPADPDAAPFCSKRCSQQDLAKWLNGSYAIPGEPVNPHPTSAETDSDYD